MKIADALKILPKQHRNVMCACKNCGSRHHMNYRVRTKDHYCGICKIATRG